LFKDAIFHYNKTAWSRVFPEKPMVAQILKKFQTLMVPEGHCRVQNNLPMDPTLSLMIPVYIIAFWFFKVSF
jgi:hypothetical protein